jgi:GNAT superfamily N-acetyltransferase
MSPPVFIRSLEDCPVHAPTLADWYRREWGDHFRHWSSQKIITEFFTPAADRKGLPIVLVAESAGKPCGTITLRAQWRDSHRHLGPWVGGLFVVPQQRGRAIARLLLASLGEEATRRGYTAVYAGTKNLGRFLRSLGWEYQEMVGVDKESIALFRWRPAGEAR